MNPFQVESQNFVISTSVQKPENPSKPTSPTYNYSTKSYVGNLTSRQKEK